MNNNEIINIEMQVNDLGDWPERSLTYLCRSFDHLQKGQKYIAVHTTIHIGILDFNLPNITPELLSEFKMLNTKNHEVYSDKFILYVLNLTVVDSDDYLKEPNDLYCWAKLFKATTWEELKMLAEKDTYIEDTVFTLHEMTAEEKIREQCEAREKYTRDMASATAKGKREGSIETQHQMKELIKRLITDNRLKDLENLQQNENLLQELLAEYHI